MSINNFRAMDPAQACFVSEIMQSGIGICFPSWSSSWFPRRGRASTKGLLNLESGRRSRFSQPRGRPASADGKRSSTKRMAREDVWMREMKGRMRAALTGVVMKLTTAPPAARRQAMSTIGIMWPCAMRGMRMKWGFGVVVLLVRPFMGSRWRTGDCREWTCS
ncbi:hypothetical protein IEQ34_006591 [Dendrobium chrysotoxum]|uniref:Uncharacterized protein n=1 Tax=Dendrobium chrysotoxum TaxID=161865 RepID=A0AAV7H8L0_DENCH|nr:hypothetical protein IEQ34_006591 [Dendrobium chrysotoxum]